MRSRTFALVVALVVSVVAAKAVVASDDVLSDNGATDGASIGVGRGRKAIPRAIGLLEGTASKVQGVRHG